MLAGALAGLLIGSAGCAAGTPRVRGAPLAPPAPNRSWRPTRGAESSDAAHARTLPAPLVARAAALTLPDVIGLALDNNPATRERWAQAQLAVDTAQAQVLTSRAALAVAAGMPATMEYDVAASEEDVDVVELARSVESVVDEALRQRPDLQAARANVRAAQADVRAARGALLPSLSLSASSGYARANLSAQTGRDYRLSLGLSIPVFDGFARRYGGARADAGVQVELAYAEALQQSVASQVVIAFYQLQSATRVVRTTDDLYVSASAAMEVARGRYREGVGTILVAVFIPLLFMPGVVGRLFHEFAVTIALAIVISGVVSLSLTPMLGSRVLRAQSGRTHGRAYHVVERGFDASLRAYEHSLRWAMRRPRCTRRTRGRTPSTASSTPRRRRG